MKKDSFFNKIARFCQAWKGYQQFKKLPASQKEIVFYSESGQDWHHLNPYIKNIVENEQQKLLYITSTADDAGLEYKHDNFTSILIPDGFWLITLFQFLDVPVAVMTMEDLDVFYLKRSVNPVHYILIFHAMGSTHMVNLPDSYDNYDTLFCVGPHQEAEVRRREKMVGLKTKNIFRNGYDRLDQLLRESLIFEKNSGDSQKKILLAPTWGENSILNRCGEALVDTLLNAGYKVILRPHYQTLKLTPEVIETILTKHGDNPNFDYLCKMGDTASLYESDLLVCDWSSTSIEYGLGLGKPVLYIDVPKRVRNENYGELGIEPLEISIRSQIGKIVSPDELDKVPEVIESLLADPDQFRDKIIKLREELVFNVGRSAQSGSKEIVRILRSIQNRKA